MTLKAQLKRLPQIDAQFEQDESTSYANALLDELLLGYTLDQISAHAGVCRRSLSYMRHNGIKHYPVQIALEILAGIKTLDLGS